MKWDSDNRAENLKEWKKYKEEQRLAQQEYDHNKKYFTKEKQK